MKNSEMLAAVNTHTHGNLINNKESIEDALLMIDKDR